MKIPLGNAEPGKPPNSSDEQRLSDELLRLDGDIHVTNLSLRTNCAEVIVLSTIDKLLAATSEVDQRFTFTLMPCGSFYQDLKIGKPDEFDFLLCLDNLSMCKVHKIPEYPISTDGLLCLNVDDTPQKWSRDDVEAFSNKMFGTYLVQGDTINKHFVNLWNGRLNHVLPHHPNFHTESLELHNSTIVQKLTWVGYDNAPHAIKISMKIAIRSHSQVFGDFSSALSSLNPAQHPLGHMVETIRQSPVLLVPSSAWTWRISNHYCEKVVLRYLDTVSPNVKACLRVLKSLRDLFLHEEIDGAHVVDTSTLKTVLFWEAEEFYEVHNWTPASLPDRIISVLRRLRAAIDKRFLPDYFIETVNKLPFELLCDLPSDRRFQSTIKLHMDSLIQRLNRRKDEDPM